MTLKMSSTTLSFDPQSARTIHGLRRAKLMPHTTYLESSAWRVHHAQETRATIAMGGNSSQPIDVRVTDRKSLTKELQHREVRVGGQSIRHHHGNYTIGPIGQYNAIY